MRITHEADYAVRIIYTLMKENRMISAREISEESGVTLRFALKILRKLAAEGIVNSFKGVAGGYKMAEGQEDLTMGAIIECIDGPFEISHCLTEDFDCTRVKDKQYCQFRHVFDQVSLKLKDEFYGIKMSSFLKDR